MRNWVLRRELESKEKEGYCYESGIAEVLEKENDENCFESFEDFSV